MSFIFYLTAAATTPNSTMALIPDHDSSHGTSSSAIPDARQTLPFLPDAPPPDADGLPAPPKLSLRRARDVARALESERALADEEYRLALLKSYIDFKLTYHAHAGLRRKLRPLERAFPQYRGTFVAARAFYRLPPPSFDSEEPARLESLMSSAASLFAHPAPSSPRPKSPRSPACDTPPPYSEAEPLRHDDIIGQLQRMVEVERAARCAAEQRLAAVATA
ncbi:uncharacterized protein LOC62_05G007591 [Vanrija pseudolonga]|uniref:Uncharacterized protein n=1 Tax=Vanrija pseudolonga TaxID=143232 RepID=A0AAF0YI76_9TREE|nr:hypothetical protein LOC62_05G007591 [Vanrija pseudolonga]